MSKELGELRTVDVRTLWPSEAQDFTPWLAREENIGKLGEALGLELEVEQTEVPVGPYAADILARDSGGDYVIVENQLGKTDHDHLGKALTYAAILGAKTVVWVAPTFTDEHRKTLDWLNDSTGEEVSFFGVQVELWSIDGSRPAVRFSVVSRPADIVRQGLIAKSGELSESRRIQLDWWTAFRDRAQAAGVIDRPPSPRPRYWYDVPLGRAGLHLSLIASPDERRIGVRVYLRNKTGGQIAYRRLLESKDAIEKELGFALLWNPNEAAIDRTIATYREADLRNRDSWPDHLDWMVKTTNQFRQVFGPRVREMNLTLTEDLEERPGG
jgi:hypothetical protein